MTELLMTKFAALVAIGPGEIEAKRLRRLLEGLLLYEAAVHHIVIIDDNSEQRFDAVIPPEIYGRTTILPNPRNGRGNWWQGGLCVALAEGLRWIGKNLDVEFVVRLDTDALIIAPFVDRVMEAFNVDSKIGLLGTWDKYPFNGRQRLPYCAPNEILPYILKKSSRHLAIWRHSDHPTRIQCSLSKNDRTIRKIICSAVQNGYQLGDFLQGGAYAIRGQLVQDLYSHQLIQNPLAFLCQFYGEDILATLFCYSMGYIPKGFNQPGEVFGVQYKGLPATIPELKDANYSILHSVKEV